MDKKVNKKAMDYAKSSLAMEGLTISREQEELIKKYYRAKSLKLNLKS